MNALATYHGGRDHKQGRGIHKGYFMGYYRVTGCGVTGAWRPTVITPEGKDVVTKAGGKVNISAQVFLKF